MRSDQQPDNPYDRINAHLAAHPVQVALLLGAGGVWIIASGHLVYGLLVICLALVWPLLGSRAD
jgi:hypothetical protein